MAGKTRHEKARNFSGRRAFSLGAVQDCWLPANQPSSVGRCATFRYLMRTGSERRTGCANVCSSGSVRRAPGTPYPPAIDSGREVMAQVGALHWSRTQRMLQHTKPRRADRPTLLTAESEMNFAMATRIQGWLWQELRAYCESLGPHSSDVFLRPKNSC